MTTGRTLIEILVASQARIPGASSAAAHLRASSSGDEISHSPTESSELLHILSRRLRRNPEDVYGLSALVAALRTTDDEVVDLYVLAEGGTVTSVALTPAGQLLGCVVGPDRREDMESVEGGS